MFIQTLATSKMNLTMCHIIRRQRKLLVTKHHILTTNRCCDKHHNELHTAECESYWCVI